MSVPTVESSATTVDSRRAEMTLESRDEVFQASIEQAGNVDAVTVEHQHLVQRFYPRAVVAGLQRAVAHAGRSRLHPVAETARRETRPWKRSPGSTFRPGETSEWPSTRYWP